MRIKAHWVLVLKFLLVFLLLGGRRWCLQTAGADAAYNDQDAEG